MLSTNTRKVRAGVTVAGALAAVALLAPVLLPALDVFARQTFVLVAGGAVALAAALDQRRRWLAADTAAAADAQRSFDEVLACFPPPRIRDANTYDLGSLPFRAEAGEEPPPPYVAREGDAILYSALASAPFVVVTGGPGSGKSRSAVEVLARVAPDALLLVPEGGDALDRLLALDPEPLLDAKGAVLWLDGLERYLKGLQIDAVDKLRERNVRVVATVRSQTLHDLLDAQDEEGRAARRLIARAAVVEVASKLTASEQAAAGSAYPGRTFSAGIANAFEVWPCAQAALHSPPQPPPPASPPRLRNDLVGKVLMVALGLTGVAIALLVVTDRAFKPAPLADQLADARDHAAGCSTTDVYPSKASDDVRTYVFVERRSGGCNSSDELRILRVRDGKLRTVYEFQPQRPPGGFYRLVCRGAATSTPCTARGAGADPAVVAGWEDTASGIVVPFVLQARNGRYVAQPLEKAPIIDERKGAAPDARSRYRTQVTLRSARAPSIEGYPIEDFAVVASGDSTHVVRGFVWRGTFDAPEAIEAFPAELILPNVELQSCTITSGGTADERLIFRVPARDPGLPSLLRTRWTAALRGGDGTCG